jgi:hypothetical protein
LCAQRNPPLYRSAKLVRLIQRTACKMSARCSRQRAYEEFAAAMTMDDKVAQLLSSHLRDETRAVLAAFTRRHDTVHVKTRLVKDAGGSFGLQLVQKSGYVVVDKCVPGRYATARSIRIDRAMCRAVRCCSPAAQNKSVRRGMVLSAIDGDTSVVGIPSLPSLHPALRIVESRRSS